MTTLALAAVGKTYDRNRVTKRCREKTVKVEFIFAFLMGRRNSGGSGLRVRVGQDGGRRPHFHSGKKETGMSRTIVSTR